MEVIRREIMPGIFVLEMRGALLIGVACTRLQLAVEDLLAEKQTRVVLDMTAVPRVDSGGLGKIVNCLSRIRMAGGTMHFAGVNTVSTSQLRQRCTSRAVCSALKPSSTSTFSCSKRCTRSTCFIFCRAAGL